jgi:hypothetical protein
LPRQKSDLELSREESRWKKWDDQLSGESPAQKKQFQILLVGLIILFGLGGLNYFMNASAPIPIKYELGLNISYEPKSSQYMITYDNVNLTTNSLLVTISTPLDNIDDKITYVTKFEREEKTFPVNITYTPYNKDLPHVVSVTLTKTTGNYTYIYTNRPVETDSMYNNFERWLKI